MLDDVGQDIFHVVDGQGEAQALGVDAGGGLGVLGGGDADDVAVAVKQRPAGVAWVDGTVGLEHVEGGAASVVPGGDEPVQGGDDAVGEGVGQLAQGVADGVDRLAHHQLGAVPQGDGGEAAGLDLQYGHVVVLLAADELGVVLVAVGEGDLDVDGAALVLGRLLNDVVVGGDVAVLTEDKAGARGGGGGGLPPDVLGGVHRDAHAGGQVGGVELLRGHGLAAVGVDYCADLGPVLLIDGGGVLGGCGAGIEVGTAHPRTPSGDGAGQHQGDCLARAPLFPFGRLRPGLKRGDRDCGLRVCIAAETAPVAVVFVVVEVEFVHSETLLPKRIYVRCSLELCLS